MSKQAPKTTKSLIKRSKGMHKIVRDDVIDTVDSRVNDQQVLVDGAALDIRRENQVREQPSAGSSNDDLKNQDAQITELSIPHIEIQDKPSDEGEMYDQTPRSDDDGNERHF